MADKDDVLTLLRIADLAKQWPNLQSLHDHAMAALTKAAEEHKEQAEAAAKKAAEEAAKEKKEASAKDKEETSYSPPVSPRPLGTSGRYGGG